MRAGVVLALLLGLSACANSAERQAALDRRDDATCRSYGLEPEMVKGWYWIVPSYREVRTSYRQYDALAAQDLADKLYRRYYSDMPRALFDEAFFHGPGLQGRTIQEALAGAVEVKSDGRAYADCRMRLAEARANREAAREAAVSASALSLSRTLLEPSPPPQSNTTFYNFGGNPMTCTRYQNVVNCF